MVSSSFILCTDYLPIYRKERVRDVSAWLGSLQLFCNVEFCLSTKKIIVTDFVLTYVNYMSYLKNIMEYFIVYLYILTYLIANSSSLSMVSL